MAERRNISMNKLFEELSAQALAEFDSEVRFRALAASGSPERGLAILEKLDTYFAENPAEDT